MNFKRECACAVCFDVSAAGWHFHTKDFCYWREKPHLALRPLVGKLWSGLCLGFEFREDKITLADYRCDPQGVTFMVEGIYEGGERGPSPSSHALWHFLKTEVTHGKSHIRRLMFWALFLLSTSRPCYGQPRLTCWSWPPSFVKTLHNYIYIYIYIQGVPGGLCNTSGQCSLC